MTHSQSEDAAPHVSAAFINAIAEEGTKTEAVEWLQKTWNENCALRAEINALRGRGVLVPLVPTPKMIEAGCANNPTCWTEETDDGFAADVANDVYAAMVRAAP